MCSSHHPSPSLAIMTCSFHKLVGGSCGADPRYVSEITISLSTCSRDITNHKRAMRFSDVHTEIDLILARAAIFSPPKHLADMSICPHHRSSLGIGWRRCSGKCRIPVPLAAHSSTRGKLPVYRGINKHVSREIIRLTGRFVPVGSSK